MLQHEYNVLIKLAIDINQSNIFHQHEIFDLAALRLKDGTIAYIMVEYDGTCNNVSIFLGDKGLQRYRNNFTNKDENHLLKMSEWYMGMDCLSLYFEDGQSLSQNELNRFLKYFSQFGDPREDQFVNYFPHFVRRRPYEMPEEVTDRKQLGYFKECLKALKAYEKAVREGFIDDNFFGKVVNGRGVIPLMEATEFGFSYSYMALPKEIPIEYPEPKLNDEILTMKLRSLKKKDTLLIDLIHSTEAVVDDDDEREFFPIICFVYNESLNKILENSRAGDYEFSPEEFLNEISQSFLDIKYIPKEIKVANDITYYFLKDFCQKLGIKLVRCDNLPKMEEIESDYFYGFLREMGSFLGKEDFDPTDIENVEDIMDVLDIVQSVGDVIINGFDLTKEDLSDLEDNELFNAMMKSLKYLQMHPAEDDPNWKEFSQIFDLFGDVLDTIDPDEVEEEIGGSFGNPLLGSSFFGFEDDDDFDDDDFDEDDFDEDEIVGISFTFRVKYNRKNFVDIQISGFDLFYELSEAILEAFYTDYDMSRYDYNFYKYNHGRREIYGSPYDDTFLVDGHFSKDDEFELDVFDKKTQKKYKFTCTLLKIEVKETILPKVVKRRGSTIK